MRYRIKFQNKHVSMKGVLFPKPKPVTEGCACNLNFKNPKKPNKKQPLLNLAENISRSKLRKSHTHRRKISSNIFPFNNPGLCWKCDV